MAEFLSVLSEYFEASRFLYWRRAVFGWCVPRGGWYGRCAAVSRLLYPPACGQRD